MRGLGLHAYGLRDRAHRQMQIDSKRLVDLEFAGLRYHRRKAFLLNRNRIISDWQIQNLIGPVRSGNSLRASVGCGVGNDHLGATDRRPRLIGDDADNRPVEVCARASKLNKTKKLIRTFVTT